MKEITEREALVRLANLCSRAEHCSYDIRQKMERWGLTDDAQERIITRLIDGKYIDDARFTRAFILDKVHYNKWGRRKVGQALYEKHIPDSISAPLLDAIDDEEWHSSLRPLLLSRSRSIKAASSYEARQKLIRYALGRGFSIDAILECLEEIDEDND